jgi:hypothetical protein
MPGDKDTADTFEGRASERCVRDAVDSPVIEDIFEVVSTLTSRYITRVKASPSKLAAE